MTDAITDLHLAVNASCSCGGNGPGQGCGACDVWHFLHGRHWTNQRQPCGACAGTGTHTAISPDRTDLAVIGLMLTEAGIPDAIGDRLLGVRERVAMALAALPPTGEQKIDMADCFLVDNEASGR